MRSLLRRYFIIVISIYSVTQLIPGLTIQNNWSGLFYAAFILSILLYIAKPIANLIMLPINILTLNLAAWIINIVMIYLWVLLVREVNINPWEFAGLSWGPIRLVPYNFGTFAVTVITAIFLILIERFFNWLIR